MVLHKSNTSIRHVLHKIQDDLKELGKLTVDETAHLSRAVKRDLRDAAEHLHTSNKELKFWLGFDIAMIKSELWQKFIEATDQTTLELLKLKDEIPDAKYTTGEVIGLGTLACDNCHTTLHFHKPGHIPPCGKCHGTGFHRQHHKSHKASH